MRHTDSYRSRGFSHNCNHISNEDEPCWGSVRGSSRGIECEGHWNGRTGDTFFPEPTIEELREAEALAEQEAAEARRVADLAEKQARKDRIERQEANRWFRPFIEEAKGLDPGDWWAALSEPMVKGLFSFLGEGFMERDGDAQVQAAIKELALPAIAEVARRSLDWPAEAYDLVLAPPYEGVYLLDRDEYYGHFTADELALDLTRFLPQPLQIMFGCAAQVVDYSHLDRGTRQVAGHVFGTAEAELERRGIEPESLFDLFDKD